MKQSLIKLSVYLNVFLGLIALGLTYKIGLFDSFLPAIQPPISTSTFIDSSSASSLVKDNLSADPGWQSDVKHQVSLIQDQTYKSCLFGDSISAGLHNSIAPHVFNFALNGMSTVSLVEQLKALTAAHLQCSQVIIAIGTNDVWYNLSNDLFVKYLEDSIVLARKTGANQIVLIPAFYATIGASHDPNAAGSNERIDEINTLINQVGESAKLVIATNSTQPLFSHHALNEKLTVDGVHLNEEGLTLYRLALLEIINPECHLL